MEKTIKQTSISYINSLLMFGMIKYAISMFKKTAFEMVLFEQNVI